MNDGPDPTGDPAARKAPPATAVGDGADIAAIPGASPVNQLSPEEQMALFEKELKETDWGHQPC